MSNLYKILENTTEKNPEKTALIFGGSRISYGKTKEAADRMAQGLINLGLVKGDRIALMLPNIPHYVMSYFALLRAGITIVPVSIFFKAEEIHHLLEDSEVRGIIYWEEFRGDVLQAVQQLAHCEHLIVLGENPEQGEVRLNYLMEINTPLTESVETDDDDTALIAYTAGTTGRHNGAELTHGNIIFDIEAVCSFLKISDDDSTLGIIPFYHPLGHSLTLGAFFRAGGTIVLTPKMDSEQIFKLLKLEKPTYFIGLPSMLRDMLNNEPVDDEDLSFLKFVLVSGEALKEETFLEFEKRFNVPILESYGLTEAAPMVSINSPNRERLAGSMGLPLPGIEMKIIDEFGSEVNPGEVGEVIVQGPNVMKGYLNRPEATRGALRDGWLHTGDLARLHENGFGFIEVRKKNVIIKSGFNVYPREVEKYMLAHPKIKEAVIVGLPDQFLGEEVYGYLVLQQGEESPPEEIIQYGNERMAAYKCPKYVEFFESIPRGPNGRVLRQKVKEILLNKHMKK